CTATDVYNLMSTFNERGHEISSDMSTPSNHDDPSHIFLLRLSNLTMYRVCSSYVQCIPLGYSPFIFSCRDPVQRFHVTTNHAISNSRRWEVASMRRRTRATRSNRQRTMLGLLYLEHVKSAVLVSLRSPESQRSYRKSIDDFHLLVLLGASAVHQQTMVTR